MLKWSKEHIEAVDKDCPGIAEQIYRFEANQLPDCPYCSSDDTALVCMSSKPLGQKLSYGSGLFSVVVFSC